MQAVEERDDNGGSAEHDKRLLIERDVERGGFHPTSLTGPTDFSLGTARRALSAPLIVQLLMALNCKRARPNPRRLAITTARSALRTLACSPYSFIGRITINIRIKIGTLKRLSFFDADFGCTMES